MRQLADRTGLTGGLSVALPSPLGGHDRGRVFSDLACAIADGARVISDFRVLGDQRELFGQVASVPTAWRALRESADGGDRLQRKIAAAVSRARRHAWAHGAIEALPPRFRHRLMVTCDGAGASHDLVKELARLAGRRGYELTYSVGWALGERERAAIGKVPATAWSIAIDPSGEVRERRADGACGNRKCARRDCWIEEASIAELTSLLREGPGGDQLKDRPKGIGAALLE